jgi:hypothetical protein
MTDTLVYDASRFVGKANQSVLFHRFDARELNVPWQRLIRIHQDDPYPWSSDRSRPALLDQDYVKEFTT